MLLKVLHNNIRLSNGETVRIIKQDYPYDHTPCITFDDSGGTSIHQKHIINDDQPLPPDHPQYDPDHPHKQVSQQILMEERGISININIWCNTQDEREEINNQIRNLFYKVQSDHYMFCGHYKDGDCISLGGECRALTIENNRSVKSQCPRPIEYDYINIFKAYDIIRSTFDVNPSYDLDDKSANPPILRSIIKVSFNYYTYHTIGGGICQEITINGGVS